MPELPVVLVTEGSEPRPLDWLREHSRVLEVAPDSSGFDEALREAEGLVIRTYTRVNTSLLDRAPRLRVVGRGGVGIENIDVAACRGRGVEVVYTPDANTIAVGDFVIGYMLQLLRPWCFLPPQGYAPSEFKAIRNRVRGFQLDELTLGILGMGRVGRRVGHIASTGFGMRVVYHDIVDVSPHMTFAAESVGREQLLRECDVLSIHVDMRPGNENLIGAKEIALMKPSAILINTARGEVLNARALGDAIRAGRLAGAAIDVYDPEPPGSGFPLLGLPNVLLTPHLAARTATALQNMSWVVRDVIAVLNGQRPRFPAPQR